MNNTCSTIDEYIAGFPQRTQDILKEIRVVVRRSAPDAEEGISYGMPTYKLRGRPVVYFAAFKHHIGLYATPGGHAEFAEELSAYKQGKGSVQFPIGSPMPLDLIARMVEFRVKETSEKSGSK